MQAHAWIEQGELDQAAASLKRALLFDGHSAVLWLEFGDVWYELGDEALARDAWATAAEYGSDEAEARLGR